MEKPTVDPTFQIVSMWKQGIPHDVIVKKFNLRDVEHLKSVIHAAGYCWGCAG